MGSGRWQTVGSSGTTHPTVSPKCGIAELEKFYLFSITCIPSFYSFIPLKLFSHPYVHSALKCPDLK